ncbi:MAG TPA: hypothetical protein VF069_15520 [Streptosporangiaceae bacterium]
MDLCQECVSSAARALPVPPGVVPVRPPVPGRSQHCLLLAVDVAGFTARGRDDEVQLVIRDALYRLLIAAFCTCGIAWETCHHEDRGDGVLVVVPLHFPTIVVVDALVPRLRAGIRRHNRLSSEIARIRLRVAVHVGEVHRDRYGVAGVAVNHLFRLLDAPAVKETLSAGSGELALIVSDYLYGSVLLPAGEHADLDAYLPVEVALKETRARAWIQAPAQRSAIRWNRPSIETPMPTRDPAGPAPARSVRV